MLQKWILCVATLTLSMTAQANEVFINLGQAAVKKSIMGFPAFNNVGADGASVVSIQTGQELHRVISNDLTVSGFFSFISPEAFPTGTAQSGLKPGVPGGFKFDSWAAIDTDFLIRGGYRVNGNNVSLEIYLYHVKQGRLILGRNYEGDRASLRKMAHTFSDDAIMALTGKRASFNTKVVASVQLPGSKHKEIYIMDWDGANAKPISNHKSLALSPAWSKDGKVIAYTAFAYHAKAKTRNADLFTYNLESQKRFLVSYRKGINSGASFFPDGRHLLLTLSQGGNPDIYKMTVDGQSLERITRGPGASMNVEPDINLGATRIAFSSDRSGQPMIYTMTTAGTDVKRFTFAGKYNASPVWSPDGTKIAFAGYDKGHFDIFVINADGTGLKRLTDAKQPSGKGADNEDPSWSPCGRHIMFVSNRTGQNQLYVTNPDGTNERRLTTDRNSYFRAKWSPFLN